MKRSWVGALEAPGPHGAAGMGEQRESHGQGSVCTCLLVSFGSGTSKQGPEAQVHRGYLGVLGYMAL